MKNQLTDICISMESIRCPTGVIAILPIAAAVLFMNFRSSTPPESATIEVSRSPFNRQDNKPLNNIPTTKQIKPLPLGELEARQRLAEAKKVAEAARARSVETASRVGEMHTPEYCDQFADRVMQKREPGYRKIFAAWNIDTNTSAEVLNILREREFRQAENRGKYMRNIAPISSGKVHQFDQQTEDLVAKEQLNLLLGEKRTSELFKAVDQMQAVEVKTALSAAGLRTTRTE